MTAVAIAKVDSADREKMMVCKPSQLPIYKSSFVNSSEPRTKQHKPSKFALTIEESVRSVRTEVEKVNVLFEMQKNKADRMYVDFLKDTQRKSEQNSPISRIS